MSYFTNQSSATYSKLHKFYTRIKTIYEKQPTLVLQDLYGLYHESFNQNSSSSGAVTAKANYLSCLLNFNSCIAHAGLARTLLSEFQNSKREYKFTLTDEINELNKIDSEFKQAEQLGYLFNKQAIHLKILANMILDVMVSSNYTANKATSPKLAGSELKAAQDYISQFGPATSVPKAKAAFIDQFEQRIFASNQQNKEKQRSILERNFSV